VIFNYTQPAEDAVDEALTGLKSALAVKIFGPALDSPPGLSAVAELFVVAGLNLS
jgi:Cu/Ag efflux pump CusA